MHSLANHTNPYQPPINVIDGVVGTTRILEVGESEISTVYVTASIWTGIRTFVQNAEGVYGPVHKGPVEFQVGERERHRIRIDVDGSGKVDAYLDDMLYQTNLFAELRSRIFVIVILFMITIAALALSAASLLFAA